MNLEIYVVNVVATSYLDRKSMSKIIKSQAFLGYFSFLQAYIEVP